MQFFKIFGQMAADESDMEDRRVRRDMSAKISAKTEQFNGGSEELFCFVSDLGNDYVKGGIIAAKSTDVTKLTKRYLAELEISATVDCVEEISFETMRSLLRNANRQCYIEDDDEVLDLFGLDSLVRGINFGENMVEQDVTREALLQATQKTFSCETLIPELDRIYAGGSPIRTQGHPVHYIVQTDDRDTRRQIYKIVLDALYANHRLKNRRYSFLDFHADTSYSESAYETLYKISDGGAVVVRYLSDGGKSGEEASSESETIANICEMAAKYRNSVLTVLCFPRECSKLKNTFYNELGSMTFVELEEDFLNPDTAREFLSSRAREHHLRTDKALFSSLEIDRCYLATELQEMFDEWFNRKLKTTVYPQYKELGTVQKKVVKAKPRGSAYDELEEMIGLTDAKQVIKKAINYYKMQKLYEQKGVARSSPAMHMIFSGNPGTAKTTVARLFARIMRENGLLSRGHLVEVGRADLVGQYVGWTAPTIKAKFKAARGGVLFIDEAYSLVDGRDGSFGDEAINTIVQEMENHREELVVIFAGYPDKMEGFLQKNPGLRSRIAFHVPFADYSSEELCRIADMICKKNGMKITTDARGKLEQAFRVAREREDFGNGRYVRNLFEQAKMNQASRILEKEFDDITTEDITTITAEDIVIPADKIKAQKRPIGFC